MFNHVLGVQIKRLDSRIGDVFPLPSYATESAAGLDLRACLSSPLILIANTVILIPTGIAIHIDNPFVTAMILPRSGLGHKNGIILGNSVGLIDADYQGELQISCWNRSTEDFTVNPGDRMAQLVFMPVVRANFEIVTEFSPSQRGEGGFGHTGTL